MHTCLQVHEAAVKAAVESAMKVAEQREKEAARALGTMGKELGTKVDQLGKQLPNQVRRVGVWLALRGCLVLRP